MMIMNSPCNNHGLLELPRQLRGQLIVNEGRLWQSSFRPNGCYLVRIHGVELVKDAE